MVNSDKLKLVKTTDGDDLYTLSKHQPVLLVFLRHFGCIFCREALHDLGEMRKNIENKGVKLVLVCMSEPDLADSYFEKYGLEDVTYISDPKKWSYASFGLARGGASELLGLKNFIRGFELLGKNVARPAFRFIGDGFQMPGVFVLNKGEVVDRFIHVSAADRPDYMAMIEGVKK